MSRTKLILELLDSSPFSTSEICRHLGVSREFVRQVADRFFYRGYLKDRRKQLMVYRHLIEKFGISPQLAFELVKKYDLKEKKSGRIFGNVLLIKLKEKGRFSIPNFIEKVIFVDGKTYIEKDVKDIPVSKKGIFYLTARRLRRISNEMGGRI